MASRLGRCVRVLGSACGLFALSCQTLEPGSTWEAPAEALGSAEQAVMCRSVQLIASKTYGPSQWQDDAEDHSPNMAFAVPAFVPVTNGNAGNHTLKFRFRKPNGVLVSCNYKGGSSQAHPNSPAQIALGLKYHLQSCGDGSVAGSTVTANRVELHIDNGDSYLSPTTVNLVLAEVEPCSGDPCEGVTVTPDGNPCTEDLCDSTTGAFVYPADEGAACDDLDACTGSGTCDAAAVCQPGAPIEPDDDPCTIESCGPDGIVTALCSDIDPTVTSTLGATLAFLYTGTDPVQTNVAPGAIDELQAAAVVGHVLGADSQPLSGASVRVVGQADLGSTTVGLDGRFVLAVNGGAALTVAIEADGYLSAHRIADASAQQFVDVGSVILIAPDPNATIIELDTISEIAVAEGSEVVDDDGSRQTIVMFTPGTSAWLELPDGTLQPADTLTLRVTEYTQGPQGSQRMAASLPPTSAYTFAAEVSADEAIAAGTSSILLDQPVSMFVDNFLGFPVGTAVPVGVYQRARAAWVPTGDGVVLEIVSTAGGVAAIDLDGDGVEEDDTTLESYGLSIAEREDLALRYVAGAELWHAELSHFSMPDFNLARRLAADACLVMGCDPADPPWLLLFGRDPRPPCAAGSVIECTNQSLGEEVEIAGTGHALHYRSNRTHGGTPRSVTIPLSGPSLPASLIAIRARIHVAGQVIEEERVCPCATNDSVTLSWDGSDLFGRQLAGLQAAVVEVGYEFATVYSAGTPTLSAAGFARMFGTWSGTVGLTVPSRDTIELVRKQNIHIGGLYNASHALGGFSFDVVHAYDILGGTLYRGDGTERQSDQFVSELQSLHPAPFGQFRSLATMANNDLIYSAYNRVFRVSPDGTETLIASFFGPEGQPCQPGDSAPALNSCLIDNIANLTPAPDGSIYATAGRSIVRIVPGGNATRIAGFFFGGGSTAEGIPATQASLALILAIALASDGSLYVAQHDAGEGFSKIRRIGPDGTIRTVAGVSGQIEGNGGHASLAAFPDIADIAFGPDGSLYVVHQVIGGVQHVRRVRPDGIVEAFAGYGGDNDPTGLLALDAMSSRLTGAGQITVGRDGTVYINDGLRIQSAVAIIAIRAISPDGKIRSVAGAASYCFPVPCGTGGPAVAAGVGSVENLHTAPDGSVRAYNGQYAYAVLPDLPQHGRDSFLVAETDGRTVYRFDASGRHLETLDAETLAVMYTIAYDAAGRLSSITDVDNLTTTIQRDAFGEPTAIVGPYGHTTALTIDADGFLASVEDPTGVAWSATYQEGGLIESWTNRDGHTASFQWDSAGRLIQHQHPGGGFTTLDRTNTATGHQVTLTTPLGRTTTYKREHDAAGSENRVTTLPSGLAPGSSHQTNGTQYTAFPDGTLITRVQQADDRWGMESPIPVSEALRLPSGLTRTISSSRSFSPPNFVDPLLIDAHTETVTINGRTWTSSYNVASRVQTTTSPLGRITRSTLDARGRVIKLESPDVLDVHYSYDADGRLETITQGTRVATVGYGADGLASSFTDPITQESTASRNARGDVLTVTGPDSEVTALAYNGERQPTQVTPPDRPLHALAYNEIGELAGYDPPSIGFPDVTGFDYDLDKQIELVTQPGPRLVAFEYDTAGRIDEMSFPNGILSTTYSPTSGHLTQIDGPDGVTINVTYDGSLPKSVTWAGDVAATIAWTHDTNFRPTTETINGSWSASFGYDLDSLLTSAGALTLTRDVESGRVHTASSGNVSETFSYSEYGEPAATTATYSGGPLLDLSYVRDDLGRIVEKTETIGGITTVSAFTYNEIGRLLTVTEDGTLTESYSYDPSGNRTSALNASGVFGAAFDDHDRIIGYGSNLAYVFSDAGDLVEREDIGTSELTTFDYDAVGNLRSVTLPNGDILEYSVDGAGRRVGKTVNGVFERGWIWRSQLQPVAELDASGAVAKRFVYGDTLNAPALMTTSTGVYRLVKDHVGSVRFVVDVATGTIAQELSYDSYGRVLEDTNPGFQPFGFAGGLYDPDTGLVRLGARDYDAEIGRWTAKDPIGLSGGLNLYEYAGGDPVNLVDPSGLWIEELIKFNYSWGTGTELISLVRGARGDLSTGSIPCGLLKLRVASDLVAAAVLPALGGAGRLTRAGTETFEIVNGVRRAKAAELAGRLSIYAEGFGELPLANLRSPFKSAIDVSSSFRQFQRWQSILDATKAGRPLPPIQVQRGSRGPSIFDVFFE